MHNKSILFFATLLALTFASSPALLRAQGLPAERSTNWHQWRGPDSTGVAPQANPPIRWDENTNIKWKVSIPGEGSATPIVWQDRIYLATAVPASGGAFQFTLMCLDRETGRTLWSQVAREEVPHEGHHETNTHASSSPVTDGENIYVWFGSHGIYSYDMNGRLRWEKDLGDMQTRNGFGEGSSPALYGDKLILTWDHEGDSFIVALDANTSQELWRKSRDEPTTWGTPLVVEAAGKTQVIVTGQNRMRRYDLANGDLIWECSGLGPNPIPAPIVFEDKAILMTGYRSFHAHAVSLDSTGDVTGTSKVAWSLSDGTPYIASPLLYDDLIYITKERNNILTCLDARTGQPVYANQRLPGLDTIYASSTGAAGRVYIAGRNGTVLVLRHGREFEVLASNRLDDEFDATPVAVGDILLLRGVNTLYCISED